MDATKITGRCVQKSLFQRTFAGAPLFCAMQKHHFALLPGVFYEKANYEQVKNGT